MKFSMTAMRYLGLAFAVLMLCSADGKKLVKTQLTKEVSVSLPVDFTPMTDDDIARRYPSHRKPVAMFTDQSRNVDFGLNTNRTEWKEEDLPMMQKFYKSSIMSLYNKVDFINEEIKEVGKRKFIVLEFTSEVSDPEKAPIRKYTLIQYTIAEGNTMIFNFTCNLRQKDEWQPTAHAIMQTVKIKK
jgi:hypothetical protein